ncbi:Ribosome maturation protein [Musa troglodytarum]|uniref:Ribosome maturation protein n=1 Tax=Musa troglodytarum TaxID=320322 RepID=A0A9E7FX72_9LILI|nr:Ribosome maturation protein [Musa troglodytarum]
MLKSLVQPIGQKRLTGIAIVRLKKHGVRFEIACYNNKLLSWRSRVLVRWSQACDSEHMEGNAHVSKYKITQELASSHGFEVRLRPLYKYSTTKE